MAKTNGKKKNIRLQRRIRKTTGVVCLITALLVAAIPVPEARADGEVSKYTWESEIWQGSADKSTSVIPVVPADCDTIYTTKDGTYQFAFVKRSATSSEADKIAVILGYNARTLEGNYLEIPDTVDAFTKYSENVGSGGGYVAVSRSQKPLYYMESPEVYETDVSGNSYLVSEAVYKLCYAEQYNLWSGLDLENFYYLNDEGKFIQTTDPTEQWIKSIEVIYIGNQTLVANDDANNETGAVQEWKIAEDDGEINTDPSKGIFANKGNIVHLVVGERLVGIGNYAFYGCNGLESIELGNGLMEIGHHAFANCSNMNSIGIEFNSNLQYIADYTFQNCRALTSFVLPAGVTAIYDYAFEGCTRLGSESLGGMLDLAGASVEKNVNLQKLGYGVFKGCTGLADITLPESMLATEKVNLNNFEGCEGLKHILVENRDLGFEGTDTYTVDNFKSDVKDSFYFEAVDTSVTHEFTKENAIAFKYADEDCYEMIMVEDSITTGQKANLTYRVNSNNELLYFNMTNPVAEVEIPATIGPYGISAINPGSFSGNCYLTKITIPATVTRINENAFKGCHNLEHVIFANAAGIKYIGTDAFATQVVEFHSTGCDQNLELTPSLTFTGTVGTGIVPYDYAMSSTSKINAGQQAESYITYYSGWPTNLEIQYKVNKETGKGAATLVDYPTYSELTSKYTAANYPYITSEYQAAAVSAVKNYEAWLISPATTEVTDYEWDIINAALNVSVPKGVKALDTGLFSGVTGKVDENGNYVVTPVKEPRVADTRIQSVTLADITEYEPYTFSGCSALTQITITGGAEKIADYAFAYEYTLPDSEEGSDSQLTTITMTGGGGEVGNYAFNNNKVLQNVTLSSTVSSLGVRPFRDCPILEDVSFSGGPYFVTDKAIVFGLQNGNKDSIVQCLESRGNTINTPGSIGSAEVTGVTSIAEEAFKDCEGIGSVDLSSSKIGSMPQYAFNNTPSLYSVVLPTACKSISKYAFTESNVRYVDIPSSVSFIDPLAFNTEQNPDKDGQYNIIEFYCEADSAADIYADEYESIKTTDKPVSTTFTVTFWDWDSTIIDSQEVLIGQDAVAPADPVREGYTFTGWLPNFTAISKDTDVVAQYTKIDSEETKYTVRFIDYDDTVLYEQRVAPGSDAILPQSPTREGYTFTGWRPAITGITKDTDTYAQYEKITSDGGAGGNGSGGNGNGGNGNGNGDGSLNGTNATLYTLTVENGSGSGSYVAGAPVPIIANEPASTQEFDRWETDNSSVKFVSTSVAATFMTMPAENVTVTATFKNRPGGSGGNNSGGSGNNGGNTISGNTTGSVIVIDKNGLSNTGVVSATINGSSDNFVIKVSDDVKATEAVLKALQAEYGSLDNIKYFPMDISLYDSTGKIPISDTTGLSISITLPLPDAMIPYAGNNKVAGVVNDRLDKLSAKFTTIDGVACVTFKAEHFSPYVIYVNTEDLSSTGVVDSSPKTGDIHPKWFVVTGLSCVAVFLFMKKDKTGNKTLVKA